MLSTAQENNPVFLERLVERTKRPFLALCRSLLSMGCINYYVNDETWRTRVFIHNYFPLLNGGEVFSATYEMRLYRSDGTLGNVVKGQFSKAETAVVELSSVSGLDTHGIIHMQIRDADSTRMLSRPYSSIFFPEYYVPGTKKRIMAHCLGSSPKAAHFDFDYVSTSIETPSGYDPFLLIGNSCRFHRFGHSVCSRVSMTVTNQKGEDAIVRLKPFAPLSSQRVYLFREFPELRSHVGDQPYALHLLGKNILHRPVLIQADSVYALGEHL